MRDIRVQFAGENGSRLLLNKSVDGKLLTQQKYLINTGTSKGSDAVFTDRGTDLATKIVGGNIVDATAAEHVGNFAALDTLYFCSYEEHPEIFNRDSYVRDFDLRPMDYNNYTHTLTFKAKFIFKDNTSTEDTLDLTTE